MRLRALAVAIGVLAADQAVKALVRAMMDEGQRVDLAGPLAIVSARNDGVAFGALGGLPPLALVAIGAAILVVLVLVVRGSNRTGLWVAAGMIAGGAAGNLTDRVLFGAVTDYVKVSRWPAFNLADAAIVCGGVALVWFSERSSASDAPA
ncbi:MAG: signal peptidase II [Baekduia sp.]